MEQQTSGKRAFFGYFLSLATKSYSPQAKFGKSIEEVRFFAVLRMTEIAGQARNDMGNVRAGHEKTKTL
jgi:hypothetical protein